jgi:hypothetical protein
MTIEEIRSSDKAFLTAADVAPVLKSTDNSIRVCARQRPDLLGFPVTIMGNRVRIPRIPFLEYLGYKQGGTEGDTDD